MDSGFDLKFTWKSQQLDSHLNDLAGLTGRTVGGILRQSAPTLARYLAEATLPVVGIDTGNPDGGSLDARNMGRIAVGRDLMRTYASAATIYKELQSSHDTKTGRALARAFYKRMKTGDHAGAKEICVKAGIAAARLDCGAWDNGARHKAVRVGGRVRKSTRPVVIAEAALLKGYVKLKQEKVGFAKSGWITAGAMIFKIGRVGQWIRRHQAPGVGEDRTSNASNPGFSLTNNVEYISDIFTARYEERVYRAYLHSLDQQITIALQAEYRKAFQQAA